MRKNGMGGHQSAAMVKEEWFTPRHITDALGSFDLDVCDSLESELPPIAPVRYLDRGLEEYWFGRVWCNPPYGLKAGKWLEKLAAHGNGIALIFARTETSMFFKEVWGKADGIFF